MINIFKIFLPFLICVLTFADNNQTTLVDIFENLKKVNAQIEILSADQNSSVDTKILNTKKSELLSKIPQFITKTDFSDADIKSFYAKKSALEKTLKNITNKQSQNYVKNAIELENLNINELFFKSIISLNELFKKGAKSSEIKAVLQDALIQSRTDLYVNLKELSQNVPDSLKDEFNELEISKKTSEDALNYLKENADLLASSYVASELIFHSSIDTINEKIGIKIDGVNFGKILLIIVIFAFFISLTRILARLTYALTLSFFDKTEHAKAIKDQILQIIKKPISSLLITYSLKICIGIAYYPTPMPLWVANTFSIVYIVLISWFVITILNGYGMLIIGKIAKKSGRKEVVNLILKIVYFIIFVISLLLILSRLGFDISAIIASLGIGGLAVAFAAKDIIANFFASVMLLFDNSFSQGDLISCGSIEGTIVEIGLRKTTIRSSDNALIFVPNSTLASDPIINWSRRKAGRMISLTIGLTYDSSKEALQKCISEINDMLLTHPEISRADNGGAFRGANHLKFKESIVCIDDLAGYKNAICVSLDALNSSSIDISVICFTKTILRAEYIKIKEDVIFKIMDIVAKNGLDFAFPSQSLYVEKFTPKG